MKLWCFDDAPHGWGKHLQSVAKARGIDARLFTRADQVDGGYTFIHLRQHPPEVGCDKQIVEAIKDRTILIPDIQQLRVYEDKLMQFWMFGDFMPKTYYTDDEDYAHELAETVPLPVISKSREGSNSENVRFVQTREAAHREVSLAFGEGFPINLGRRQKGYILWQKFLDNNDGDYRVTCMGRQRIMWKRFNRPDRPMASGSGRLMYLPDGLNEEQEQCMADANTFFATANTKWCALDMKKDHDDGTWKVLETTTGWPWGVFTDHNIVGTKRNGLDAWPMLLDDIESGFFWEHREPVTPFKFDAAKQAQSDLSIVCWQWNTGYRDYKPQHVNVLYNMCARHMPGPFRFICVTDETVGFDPHIELIPIPREAKALLRVPSPEGKRFPSCYMRLWTFSDAARMLGERVLLLDIDLIVQGDLSPLVNRSEDFVGWRPVTVWGNHDRVAGGSYLLRTGSRTKVWDDFVRNPQGAQRRAHDAGFRGSDQAWISFCLGKDAAVYSHGLIASPDEFENATIKQKIPYGKYIPQPRNSQWYNPPPAPLIQFCGNTKPWMLLDVPWISEHWR